MVTINMNNYGDALYNFSEKVEVVLDVRIDQDKRDARQALDKIQVDLRSQVGLDVNLDIDFGFATSSIFLAKSLDDRTKMIKQIYQSHLPRLVLTTDG